MMRPVIKEETSNYAYNTEKNRLRTAGASGFDYDLEGQLSTKDLHSFSFDYNHRLETVSGANSYQYFYDGSGKRLKAIRDSVETRYIYGAAGNLLAEANSSNVIMKYYIHGAGLMAMVTDTNEVYTYHYDAIGNTIAMTDETEVIVNSYAYSPFGILANENESIQQPFKFVGQFGVMTEPNGFYYMRARYYDTEVGRFISEDPIGFDGGQVNLYAYVGNNPLMFIDPFGLNRESSSGWNSAFSGETITRSHGLVTLATNGPPDSSFMRQRELTGTQWVQLGAGGMVAPAVLAGGAVAAESAAGIAAINLVLTNPATLAGIQRHASDFIVGATPGSPTPTNLTSFSGAATSRIIDTFSGRTEP